MNFNGIDMTSILKVNRITGRGLAEWEVSTLSVPNRDGLYYNKGTKRRKERVINVDFTIMARNMTELRAKIDELNAILDVDEPKPLIFPDEPDKTYYAIPETPSNGDDGIDYINQSTIKFICPDPYKYGREKEVTFESSTSFDVEGSKETAPVIEVELIGDTTYLAVADEDGRLNMVGDPADYNDIPVEPMTKVFESDANNLIGWTVSSPESIEEVPMTGTLKTDGTWFYTDDYGVDPTYWHGPSMKTSFPEPVQDFSCDVGLRMVIHGQGQAGIIMVFLLDASNLPVARLMMTKRHPGWNMITPEFRAGTVNNKFEILREEQEKFQHNFEGILRLRREGIEWTGSVHRLIGPGRTVSNATWRWYDYDGIATGPITQVQVRILQRENYPTIEQRINDIDVYKINSIEDGQLPIIGKAGDIIVFDHQNDNILRNGESIIRNKAFIGEYFKLKPGLNKLVVEPAGTISTTKVRYRPRWH